MTSLRKNIDFEELNNRSESILEVLIAHDVLEHINAEQMNDVKLSFKHMVSRYITEGNPSPLKITCPDNINLVITTTIIDKKAMYLSVTASMKMAGGTGHVDINALNADIQAALA